MSEKMRMHVYYQNCMYTQIMLSNLLMYTSRIVSFILTQDDVMFMCFIHYSNIHYVWIVTNLIFMQLANITRSTLDIDIEKDIEKRVLNLDVARACLCRARSKLFTDSFRTMIFNI